MYAQPSQTLRALGCESFLRVDGLTRPGEYALDSANLVASLAALGGEKAVAKENLDRVKRCVLNSIKAEVFTLVVSK